MNDFVCLAVRQHLLLLNTPNKSLIGTEDYYPRAYHPSYVETQLSSVEAYMTSINQIELKERTRSEVTLEQMESQYRALRAISSAVIIWKLNQSHKVTCKASFGNAGRIGSSDKRTSPVQS